MRGIATYGVYVPYWRLDRKALAAALGAPSGSGTRSVASYDEDTTSLGVEAARAALRRAPRLAPEALYFATASPAYLDKTNATAIHAALDLAPSAPAFDMAGAVRSGAGALRATLDARGTALAVLSDIRTGLPGSADEREGGDGAVAFLCGDDSRDSPVLAEPVASGSATAEFLERWRLPGEPASRQWEERFGEHVYVPLGESAVTDALKQAGVTAPSIGHWVLTGPHARAAATARSPAARGAARRARRGVEVRVHRKSLPGVRRAALAAAARVREVPRRGPDGARAARRRPGDDRDVHGGPTRVLALAARRRGGHRFRGRRPVPV